MTDVKHPPDLKKARLWGWLSGLGIFVVPWIVAGIISTFTPDPEATFPWVLAASFAGMIGWIILGSLHLREFRRGAAIGGVVALSVLTFLVATLLWLQP